MLRTKGQAGTGNVFEAVRHMKQLSRELSELNSGGAEISNEILDTIDPSLNFLDNKMPVVTFAAGGIATPADAALMMRLGADGVFVGSVIKKYFIGYF